MRIALIVAGVVSAVVFLAATPVQAEYLINTDFKSGMAGWRGDASPAFLKPDGTEGDETDKDVVPVLKIVLSHGQPRSAYQEYDTKDNPKTQHIRVQVYASADFKRSKYPTDYTNGINWPAGAVWYWSVVAIPNVDFWLRGDPGYAYKMADLKPGKWVTIDVHWDSQPVVDSRAIWFNVPAGQGTIYLMKPSASK